MHLEKKVDQLTELISELIPTVDKLALSQVKTDEQINSLVQSQSKTNIALGELRMSNYRLADAIDKLVTKIDKLDQFEQRLTEIEKKLK